ncbi:MAG TPA: zinc ribbon domain-containing protein [Candidatus Kapabacteria bacterium]|nr:zinc ribbon domain-containing protein [Candidatus Kapabacteria bacterium]
MPTYEYRCHFCHRVSDAFQRMSDAPLVKCPYCGKEGLERIVSGGAGVIYKGEGWYVTDYSKKSSGGKEPETKTETKTDTPKPETSSGTKPDSTSAPSSQANVSKPD